MVGCRWWYVVLLLWISGCLESVDNKLSDLSWGAAFCVEYMLSKQFRYGMSFSIDTRFYLLARFFHFFLLLSPSLSHSLSQTHSLFLIGLFCTSNFIFINHQITNREAGKKRNWMRYIISNITKITSKYSNWIIQY